MSRLRLLPTLALLSLCTMGCTRNSSLPAPAPAVVTVSQPLEKNVTDQAAFTGRTAAVESVDLRARVSGYLVDIDYRPGQEVKEGQVLFKIDPTIYQAAEQKAKADVDQFAAQVRLSEADYKRSKRLAKADAIAQEDVDRIVAQRDQATANEAAAKAALKTAEENLAWTKVTAPVAGRTSVNLLTKGNLVVADQTLLTTIVSQDPMYVYFDVDTSTMLRVKKLIREGKVKSYEQTAYPVEIGLPSETGYPHRGRIDYVSNQVTPGTGTLNVRGTFANADRVLTPGLFVRVRVPIGPPHKAMLVADRALGSDQGQPYLLTVDDKDQVVRRDVQVAGLHDGGLREITAGLKASEWVIVDGLLRVRPGVTAAPKKQPMPTQPTGEADEKNPDATQGSKPSGSQTSPVSDAPER